MDWLNDLLNREEHLKKEIAELKKASASEVSAFDQYIKPKVEAIQATIDDYLCGRNEAERSYMTYKVHLNLPVFSHLRSIYDIHSPINN
ncbi:unnamed protein product [marine sediment metagenome]|uniref:Uncharacterized protein n=1 Tax=marine sediment metagenome TaxID=412755 RepID=X1C967_9ZZZZ